MKNRFGGNSFPGQPGNEDQMIKNALQASGAVDAKRRAEAAALQQALRGKTQRVCPDCGCLMFSTGNTTQFWTDLIAGAQGPGFLPVNGTDVSIATCWGCGRQWNVELMLQEAKSRIEFWDKKPRRAPTEGTNVVQLTLNDLKKKNEALEKRIQKLEAGLRREA